MRLIDANELKKRTVKRTVKETHCEGGFFRRAGMRHKDDERK